MTRITDTCGPDCIGVPCCTPWSRWSDCPCGGYWDHADCQQDDADDAEGQDTEDDDTMATDAMEGRR